MTFFANIPFFLTLFRVVAALSIVPALFWGSSEVCQYALLVIVLLAATSDFFDGYLARRWQQVTISGAVFDHVADKLLMVSLLIGFLAIGRLEAYWVLVLIGREIVVMGMREWALLSGFSVPVALGGKIKTALLFLFFSYLLLFPAGLWFESLFLVLVLVASIISAAGYFVRCLKGARL
ncbi:MAG: CDP-diacylglycerol--glycerol-3-phosphate 3-phosphatidyltransferase [Candidatus Babeliaceae bacterium]|nr:CDP-diacylglycerol--glycerol-3-phosphate 3-phosphatidyltransferase [Candidatus Babeliaceae bacterium]